MSIKALFIRLINLQIFKYGIVGIASTLVHVGVSFSYLYLVKQDVFVANILAFMIAFIFSYVVQSLVVFKHALHIFKVIKYFVVQFSSFLAAYFSSTVLSLQNSYIQTMVIIFLLPLITFLVHKFWTFKEEI